ncbi:MULTISPECIES: oligosaccharide flippase family protein [unclassified Enterobacter]|uniref:oligosaccharide flippase family protein n=1 Tax=unclassified Enterobacter TaxID=2608935 RepID=UPI00143097AA|nr:MULTISPECIES: oligosaccharide flippase family protein [unclassified Enterobacter]MBM1021060.1 oligosaccharide flippase family protein [Enterobacter sp. E1]MEA3562679.1 oligosaccharide flippase family protein [Enterobacter sp. GM-22]MEA3596087.1 oligosaccharide flippase family protein [Enterobacter sp. GM-31]
MKKNIILLFFVQASNYLFPLLSLPYLMRVLGAENFGIVAMVQAWIQYIIIFVDYGFNFSATLLISVNKSNQSKIDSIYTAVTAAKMVLLLIVSCIFSLYVIINGMSVYSYLILLGMISVIGTVLFPVWLFQGIEKMQGIAICTTLAKCVSLLLIFLLVKTPEDMNMAVISQSSGMFISGILACIFIKKQKLAKFTRVSKQEIYSVLSKGFDLFVSNITISFYTTLNILIIGYFGGPTLAGYFSAADKIRTAAQGLMSPVQQAMFPRVSSLISEGKKLKEIWGLYGKKFIAFGFLISFSMAVIGYPASLYYYSAEYHISSLILLVMSPLPLIVSVGIVFGQWWLIPNNLTKIVRKTYLAVSLMHIIVSVILMHITPVYGVTISVIITEIIVSAIFVLASFNTGKILK